jgi:hypothetical protein
LIFLFGKTKILFKRAAMGDHVDVIGYLLEAVRLFILIISYMLQGKLKSRGILNSPKGKLKF